MTPRFLRKRYSVCLILMLVLLFYVLKKRKKYDARSDVLPILVMACNRPYLKRCLESLIKYRPRNESYPIIVSQDCRHEETYQIIKYFANRDPSITFVQQPDQSDIPRHHVWAHLKGYYKISRHYKFALNHVFRTLKYKAAIIIEDDLEISPDFYEYFRGTYPLLFNDPSIWCVSAWNDNCKEDLVEIKETELLHRTDFFPGLGWMLLSQTWDELEPLWPEAYFDDWLRDPGISRGRVCIRPEISRTFNFGKHGVSNTRFFDQHLRNRVFNKHYVPFTIYDLSYLLKANEHFFISFVYSVPEVSDVKVILDGSLNNTSKFVRVLYSNNKEFRKFAKTFGLMDDLRHGVPRTGLRGIVQFFFKGRRVFLVPKIKRYMKNGI